VNADGEDGDPMKSEVVMHGHIPLTRLGEMPTGDQNGDPRMATSIGPQNDKRPHFLDHWLMKHADRYAGVMLRMVSFGWTVASLSKQCPFWKFVPYTCVSFVVDVLELFCTQINPVIDSWRGKED
jgi:hypothetical protein